MEQQQTKLSLIGLIAIVVGGIIGGGIFNIAKILAHQASLGAIIISWIISGIGILAIALTFKTLISVRPDLSNGIYSYTRSGFGEYAGFNIAWGYWMGNAIGNAVLAIMLNDAFGLFFPLLLKHSWPTLIFCSIFTWLFTFIVARGMKLAATINTLSTILKFSSLLLIIFLLFSFADYSLMDFDFWGKESHLGPLSDDSLFFHGNRRSYGRFFPRLTASRCGKSNSHRLYHLFISECDYLHPLFRFYVAEPTGPIKRSFISTDFRKRCR